jgi:hypothetical protein
VTHLDPKTFQASFGYSAKAGNTTKVSRVTQTDSPNRKVAHEAGDDGAVERKLKLSVRLVLV